MVSNTVSCVPANQFVANRSNNDQLFERVHMTCHPSMQPSTHAHTLPGGTPLYFAVTKGYSEVVRLLVHAGSDVQAKLPKVEADGARFQP